MITTSSRCTGYLAISDQRSERREQIRLASIAQRDQQHATMADAAVLAAALTALANAVATLNTNNAANAVAAAAPTVRHSLLDPFDSNDLFDLCSRAGSVAFAAASAPLDESWDGSVDTFPSFIVTLRFTLLK
jgi:hypothetical protein